jgi:hypothetical protein
MINIFNPINNKLDEEEGNTFFYNNIMDFTDVLELDKTEKLEEDE